MDESAVGSVWLFDVDGCLIDSLTGTSLRPGAREILDHLRAGACTLLLWSAGGADYAQRRAVTTGVAELFNGFHSKAERDDAGRYRTAHFLDPDREVVFVDDRPEDLPVGADIIAVSPYLAPHPHDRGLAGVAQRVGVRTLSD